MSRRRTQSSSPGCGLRVQQFESELPSIRANRPAALSFELSAKGQFELENWRKKGAHRPNCNWLPLVDAFATLYSTQAPTSWH
jgi:hypothetical protein